MESIGKRCTACLDFFGPELAVMLAVPVLGTGKRFAECLVLMPLLLLQTAQLAVRQ